MSVIHLEGMSFYNDKELKYASVEFVAEQVHDVPMWMVNHYIKTLSDCYYKLANIYLMAQVLKCHPDADFSISLESAPLAVRDNNYRQAILDMQKGELLRHKENKLFWDKFKTIERPIVFVEIDDKEYALYDPISSDGLKVTDLSYHSPIDGNLTGILDVLLDVVSVTQHEKREKEEHDAKMELIERQKNEEAFMQIVAAAKAGRVLQDPNIPEGVKYYLMQNYAFSLQKMQKINETNGMVSKRFDRTI